VQVVIKVAADAALSLHQRSPPTALSQGLSRIGEQLGVTMEPMHPGTEDPNLMSYFVLEVADQETAQRVIDCLRHMEATEAAYVKPHDEFP
jgi:hypothetical protein